MIVRRRSGGLSAALVNELMRRGLDALDPTWPIGFRCECGRSGCGETVWLDGRQYDERRTTAVLAAGHGSVVQDARAA